MTFSQTTQEQDTRTKIWFDINTGQVGKTFQKAAVCVRQAMLSSSEMGILEKEKDSFFPKESCGILIPAACY